MRRTLTAAFFISLFLFLSCKGPVGPQGPEGLRGPSGPTGPGNESLVDPSIMPKIVSTYPPANTAGPYEFNALNQIQIRFNKIMDPITVKRAMMISSSMGKLRLDTASVYSLGGDIFWLYVYDSLFNPGSLRQWKIGEVCTLSIDSTARDVNGNLLKPAFQMQFTPEPYFRVKTVIPAVGSSNVATTPTIQLQFNGKVNLSISSAIGFTPAISGKWSYIATDSTWISYRIAAPGRLAANKTYSLAISPEARDIDGHALPNQYVSTFSTIPFKMVSTSPKDGAMDVPMDLNTLAFTFSDPPDTGSVRSALRITPTIAGDLYLYPGQPYLYYVLSANLVPNTNYSVTFSTHLKSIDADTLVAPFAFGFKTAPFKVVHTVPADTETGVSLYPSLQLTFNAFVDTAAARASFSVSPAVAGDLTLHQNWSSIVLTPHPPLQTNTTYTITISTAMKSREGYHLLAPYVMSFTTGN